MPTRRAMPVLQVPDVAKAAAYYEKLGFATHGMWDEPPTFSIVQRGDVTIALDRSRETGALPLNQGWAAYIYVDDIDAVHREFLDAGVLHMGELCDRDYGCRDFTVTDLNGYHLAFGQDLHAKGPGLGAQRGKG